MRTLILLSSILLSGILAAQNLENRLKNLEKVKVTSADYTQIRTVAELEMQLTIKGSMICESGGRLRWQSDSPVKSITLIDKDSLTNYDCESGKAVKLSAKKFPWLALIRESFMDTFTGNLQSLRKRFTIKEENRFTLLLVPVDETIASWVKTMRLTFTEDFSAVKKIEIVEKSGDKLEIICSNIVINPTIPEKMWKLPEE